MEETPFHVSFSKFSFKNILMGINVDIPSLDTLTQWSITQLSMKLYFGATLQGRAVSEQKKGPIRLPFYKESYFWAVH